MGGLLRGHLSCLERDAFARRLCTQPLLDVGRLAFIHTYMVICVHTYIDTYIHTYIDGHFCLERVWASTQVLSFFEQEKNERCLTRKALNHKAGSCLERDAFAGRLCTQPLLDVGRLVFIHAYMVICVHTHIHTYIHTYIDGHFCLERDAFARNPCCMFGLLHRSFPSWSKNRTNDV